LLYQFPQLTLHFVILSEAKYLLKQTDSSLRSE
jgi:hypothetical protein